MGADRRAEELALEQGIGERRAVELDEGPGGPRPVVMDEPSALRLPGTEAPVRSTVTSLDATIEMSLST